MSRYHVLPPDDDTSSHRRIKGFDVDRRIEADHWLIYDEAAGCCTNDRLLSEADAARRVLWLNALPTMLKAPY